MEIHLNQNDDSTNTCTSNCVVISAWCIVGCLGHCSLVVTHVSFDNYFFGVVVVLCGVLCENCIVDASI